MKRYSPLIFSSLFFFITASVVPAADKMTIRDMKLGQSVEDGSQHPGEAVIEVYPVSPFKDSYQKGKEHSPMQTATGTLYSALFGGGIGNLMPEGEENTLAGESLRSGAFAQIPQESSEAQKRSLVRGETGAEDPAAGEALSEVGLCTGPRITRSEADKKLPTENLDIRFKDCANFYPAEYTVAVNFFQTYMTWRTTETSNLFDYYVAKLKSPRFMDRIQGRLMLDCIQNIVGSGTKIGYGSVFQEVSHETKRMTRVVDGMTVAGSEEQPTPEDKKFHDEGLKEKFNEDYAEVEERVYEIRRRPETVKYNEFASALARCTIPYYWNLGSVFGMVDFESCGMTKEDLKEYAGEGSNLTQKNYSDYNIEEESKIPENHSRNDDSLPKVNIVFAQKFSNNTIVNYAFDFPTYIRRCVMTKKRALTNLKNEDELPVAVLLAIATIPFTRLELVKPGVGWYNPENSGTDVYGEPDNTTPARYAETSDEKAVILRLQVYPMSISSEEIYQALRERVFNLISSEDFIKGSTGGWIPSPFAPDDLTIDITDESASWMKYCSIRLPLKTLQRATSATSRKMQGMTTSDEENQYAKERISFAWKILADRIALLQTLEVLHGAVEIAQESERLLGMLDNDLKRLIAPSHEILRKAVDNFDVSIQMTNPTTITDVLKLLENFTDDYERMKKESEYVGKALTEALKEL